MPFNARTYLARIQVSRPTKRRLGLLRERETVSPFSFSVYRRCTFLFFAREFLLFFATTAVVRTILELFERAVFVEIALYTAEGKSFLIWRSSCESLAKFEGWYIGWLSFSAILD